MTNQEYLRILEQELAGFPLQEKEEALDYVREYLEEASLDYQDAVEVLGTPKQYAKTLRDEMKETLPPAPPNHAFSTVKASFENRQDEKTNESMILEAGEAVGKKPNLIGSQQAGPVQNLGNSSSMTSQSDSWRHDENAEARSSSKAGSGSLYNSDSSQKITHDDDQIFVSGGQINTRNDYQNFASGEHRSASSSQSYTLGFGQNSYMDTTGFGCSSSQDENTPSIHQIWQDFLNRQNLSAEQKKKLTGQAMKIGVGKLFIPFFLCAWSLSKLVLYIMNIPAAFSFRFPAILVFLGELIGLSGIFGLSLAWLKVSVNKLAGRLKELLLLT